MNSIHYQKDSNGIVHLIFDKRYSQVNLMDIECADDLSHVVEKLQAEDCIGVLLRSNKGCFFAGADITQIYRTTDDNAEKLYAMSMQIKTALRTLETSGKPVVAVINGSALGAGFELALACHRRIAVRNSSTQIGFPEVSIGLLPAAGGVVRMVRLLGIQGAMPYLTQGRLLTVVQGQEAGLIDTLADDPQQALTAAIDWIKANPTASQSYDDKHYKIPGGGPHHPNMSQVLPIAPVMIKNISKGTLPAPQAILCAMVEGAQVDFGAACRIESRYFVELARGQVAKNLISTFWFQQNEIKTGKNRPSQYAPTRFTQIGVVGAGMMGAGIAFSCATKGLKVVLKDVSLQAAESGRNYSHKLLQKRLQQGRIDAQQMQQTLALITCTTTLEDLASCELVIEAVFEDRQLKGTVTRETEAVLKSAAIFASNTSTLPITGLAEASLRPENFIGIHFFSPVEKMSLVEIICGKYTSDESLAKAYDWVQQIGKTPIVVNDSRGFYTSRVFTTFVKEGIAMLLETDAASIENAAYLNGFPVGPLAVSDEVSLTLMDKIQQQTIKDLGAEGKTITCHPADTIITRMLEQQRSGKLAGQGFYDYPGDQAKRLWPQLSEQFRHSHGEIPLQDIRDRLLFVMALETVRCYEENVLRSVGDANIGSVLGIGYPHWTGGTLQFINQYGLSKFVTRASQFAKAYGDRFEPTQSLLRMAANGETF